MRPPSVGARITSIARMTSVHPCETRASGPDVSRRSPVEPSTTRPRVGSQAMGSAVVQGDDLPQSANSQRAMTGGAGGLPSASARLNASPARIRDEKC